MNYQLVFMGEKRASWETALVQELEERLRDLGLDPSKEFAAWRIATDKDASKIDWDGMLIAVWFGVDDGDQPEVAPQETPVLKKTLEENLPVFPVADTLKNYPGRFPSDLEAINGIEWDAVKLATEILKALHLTREQRRAFISYKRTDCLEVAGQLHDYFTRRGYHMFWDSVSVPPSANFQASLWGRMADVDLLVFLDTPNALTSTWVHKELARAHDLGLGVLQLVWPDRKRTPGTEFSDFLMLGKTQFQNQKADVDDRLTVSTLEQICEQAERARVRSLRARRLRVIGDLVDLANTEGLEAVVHPVNAVKLLRKGKRVADVIPFVGLPDAQAVHDYERRAAKGHLATSLILYNGLGMPDELAAHLQWLNDHHKLSSLQVAFVKTWLKNL